MLEELTSNKYISEERVIEIFHEVFPTNESLCLLGIGDDCACLRESYDLVTADASIEGVHFNLDWMSLYDAAYRCMTSNISDIAAMGGEPGAWTLALALPDSRFREKEIHDFAHGFFDCIQDHGCNACGLVGGDVVRSPGPVMMSVSLQGASNPAGVLKRSSAKKGDLIIVVGEIGASAAGLALLQGGMKDSPNHLVQDCIYKFKRPICRSKCAKMLANEHCVHAMMDLSDGLGADLPKLLKASRLSAKVDLNKFTPTPNLCAAAAALGLHEDVLLSWRVCGGEDFALLCTCPAFLFEKLERVAYLAGESLCVIGECTDENEAGGVQWWRGCSTWKPQFQSFSHFSAKES